MCSGSWGRGMVGLGRSDDIGDLDAIDVEGMGRSGWLSWWIWVVAGAMMEAVTARSFTSLANGGVAFCLRCDILYPFERNFKYFTSSVTTKGLALV